MRMMPLGRRQRLRPRAGFLLGASLTVPFIDKKLALGTWQQIILVDFDNARGAGR